MRTPIIAANWKMNKNISEVREFVAQLIPAVRNENGVVIVIAPPFTYLSLAAELLKGSSIRLAAQNMFFEEKGAYTGEISPLMLRDTGCRYVIVGHSERRQYFLENNETVNKKIKAAKKHGLDVIVCIGESLQEREDEKTFAVLQEQIAQGLEGIGHSGIVIAYEPVWAIGTGKTATPEQAQEAHAYIRERFAVLYGNSAEELCILYGGSVTPENVDSLMACRDVDGALVGGASLKADSFARIVKFRR